jgi:hypothetical protein
MREICSSSCHLGPRHIVHFVDSCCLTKFEIINGSNRTLTIALLVPDDLLVDGIGLSCQPSISVFLSEAWTGTFINKQP